MTGAVIMSHGTVNLTTSSNSSCSSISKKISFDCECYLVNTKYCILWIVFSSRKLPEYLISRVVSTFT